MNDRAFIVVANLYILHAFSIDAMLAGFREEGLWVGQWRVYVSVK